MNVPVINNGKCKDETNTLPRNYREVSIPIVNKLDGTVTTSTQPCFQFYNVTNGITLSFHQPNHWDTSFM